MRPVSHQLTSLSAYGFPVASHSLTCQKYRVPGVTAGPPYRTFSDLPDSIRPLSQTSGLAASLPSSSGCELTRTSYSLCFAPRDGSCNCHENRGDGSSIPNGVFRSSTCNSTGPVNAGAFNPANGKAT